MVDRASPLANALKPGRFGARVPAQAGLVLAEQLPKELIQIAGWSGFEKQVMPGLKAMGFQNLGDYRTCSLAKGMRLYRLAPGRVLISSDATIQLPSVMRHNNELAVLDLGHAQSRLVIQGVAVEELMARLAPIDFRISAMKVNNFVQTGIHQIAVLIHRTAKLRFEILAPITWARSLWEFICLNAAPFGYDVRVAA